VLPNGTVTMRTLGWNAISVTPCRRNQDRVCE
jgi:hypothetical protein